MPTTIAPRALHKLHNPRLYLASRSPRRRELLAQIGVHFDTLGFRNHPREDFQIDETALAGEPAIDYVQRVARAKAEYGWEIVETRKLLSQPVLAADTTLEFDGRIIGKPLDTSDALRILRSLSGQTHQVLTAVSVAYEGRVETALSVSSVTFGQLDDAWLRSYANSGEPMDKAGAYGIQGRAALFVEHLEGSYSGVMGLPLFETGVLLRRFGFPL